MLYLFSYGFKIRVQNINIKKVLKKNEEMTIEIDDGELTTEKSLLSIFTPIMYTTPSKKTGKCLLQ